MMIILKLKLQLLARTQIHSKINRCLTLKRTRQIYIKVKKSKKKLNKMSKTSNNKNLNVQLKLIILHNINYLHNKRIVNMLFRF